MPSREVASSPGKRPLGLKKTDRSAPQTWADFWDPPLPRLFIGVTWLGRAVGVIPKIALKPISRNFAFLGGCSLVDNAEPVLLSILAIVAVSQGRGSNLTPLFVCVSTGCLGEWQRHGCRLVTGRNLWSVAIGPPAGGRC